jgi:kynurenine 3-monooxygenase
MNRKQTVRIAGAGPTGALLALLLEQRGFTDIELYESRTDPRSAPADAGRSINLALADRGIHALKVAGVFERLQTTLLPMRARGVHLPDGSVSFQPYGQRPNELNYSVSRHRLNQELTALAAARPGIRFFFGHRFESADFGSGSAHIRDLEHDRIVTVPMQPLIGADGAGSVLRRRLAEQRLIEAHETDLEHGYKELTIPKGPDGGFRLAADALHIWPRGNLMLIALPNEDGSFTATLFLPKRGAVSFEQLNDVRRIEQFMADHFADVYALMPDCLNEFRAHPVGFLGTVSAGSWHLGGQCLLIGDAAHAMVPFHGQGMNCCFEDCIELMQHLQHHERWEDLFESFARARRPNTDAISEMALENYLEMRERVADPKFQLQQSVALDLERRFPGRFVPRYSMVMFHHEIPYRMALERGRTQGEILEQLTRNAQRIEDVDFKQAALEIERRLPAF